MAISVGTNSEVHENVVGLKKEKTMKVFCFTATISGQVNAEDKDDALVKLEEMVGLYGEGEAWLEVRAIWDEDINEASS